MARMVFSRYIRIISSIIIGILITSCSTGLTSNEIECPKDIGEKVVYYAKKYVEKDTEYEWGGQDFLEKDGIIKMDCSGLVVNCFKYAIAGTQYSLLFKDAAVINFYNEWTIKITDPRPGDLIFMGENKNIPPTHMSIFVRKDNINIYFIDATLKEKEGINGITERNYLINDPKFISFGRLMLNY
ncbi:hypothetical protein AGMMS49579_11060 [Spirochaetia bacterium]|nr:hypothetical protein AGMMS49579_11060 [Spirochaetia bacterium]